MVRPGSSGSVSYLQSGPTLQTSFTSLYILSTFSPHSSDGLHTLEYCDCILAITCGLLIGVMLQDVELNPLGLDYDTDPELLEHPVDVSNAQNLSRVQRCREKGFRDAWFHSYDWLQCSSEYQVVGARDGTGSVIAGEDAILTCRSCAANLLLAPRDSLGAGGPNAPRGIKLMKVKRPDLFRKHAVDPRHLALHARFLDPSTPAPAPTISFKGVEFYQLQCVINTYDTVKNHESLAAVERKRRLLRNQYIDNNGTCFDAHAKVSEYMVLEFVRAISKWVFSKFVLSKLARVRHVHGKVSDGTTDRSDEDAEVVGVQVCSLLGLPEQIFFGRLAVNYTLSRDGLSPDAPAILGSIDGYFSQQLPQTVAAKHFLLTTGWSMDGASVNLGEENGVKGLLLAQEGCGHIHVEHGKAHVVELKANAAYNAVQYYRETITDTIKGEMAHFAVSPKRQHLQQKLARLVGVSLLKLVSLHGVRWQASLTRTLKALVRGWVPNAMALHEDGKKAARQSLMPVESRKLYLSSPPASFVGLQFGRQFTGHGMCTATVVSAADPHPGGNELTSPIFLVRYQDRYEENLCKAQILDCAESGVLTVLEESTAYRLYCASTAARHRWTLAFLYDVKATSLKRLSELSQRAALTPLALNVKTDAVLAELEMFKTEAGPEEAQFTASYDPAREMYDGLTVADFEGAKATVAADKLTYLNHLVTGISEDVPASGPINEARIQVFDFCSIPTGPENQTQRASYGNSSVRSLVSQWWPVFQCSRDRSQEAMCNVQEAFVSEWQSIKARYNQSATWQLKSNEDMRKLLYTTQASTYPLFMELLEADASDPLDTSCCERWISDQNLHKTNQRTCLSASVLNDLMMISINGPPLEEVDWPAIITIWNNDCARGRYDAIWKADVAAQVTDLINLFAGDSALD